MGERRAGRGGGTERSRWTGNCGRDVTYEKRLNYHLINKHNLHCINLRFSTLKVLKIKIKNDIHTLFRN